MGYQFYRYSHTGGYAELKVGYYVVYEPWKDTENVKQNHIDVSSHIHVKVGDRYLARDYNYNSPPVYSESYTGGDIIFIDREAAPTSSAATLGEKRYLVKVESDGQVSVELGIDDYHDNSYVSPGMVTKLELVGFGDEIYTGSGHYRMIFNEKAKEMLEVDAVLTTRDSYQDVNPLRSTRVVGVNARPGVVPAKRYSGGGYMGNINIQGIFGCGILATQLSGRYNKPHNRYTMTVEGNILPSDKISYNGGYYTVEGYERDLANNTTRIIID
jgi:hypothetical protein